VLPVKLPALREHPEDIPLIANYLVEKHCKKMNNSPKKISPDLMEVFQKRSWEGNVRELENIIMQGILFSTTEQIKLCDLELSNNEKKSAHQLSRSFMDMPYKAAKEESLREFNHNYIGLLLKDHNGNVTRAAKQCGLERQALQQIMRRFGVKADEYRQ
jgi:DNA-binding NtrC family response regulator